MNNDQQSVEKAIKRKKVITGIITIVSILWTLFRQQDQANVDKKNIPQQQFCILCSEPCPAPATCDYSIGKCVGQAVTNQPQYQMTTTIIPDASIGVPTSNDDLVKLEMINR